MWLTSLNPHQIYKLYRNLHYTQFIIALITETGKDHSFRNQSLDKLDLKFLIDSTLYLTMSLILLTTATSLKFVNFTTYLNFFSFKLPLKRNFPNNLLMKHEKYQNFSTTNFKQIINKAVIQSQKPTFSKQKCAI